MTASATWFAVYKFIIQATSRAQIVPGNSAKLWSAAKWLGKRCAEIPVKIIFHEKRNWIYSSWIDLGGKETDISRGQLILAISETVWEERPWEYWTGTQTERGISKDRNWGCDPVKSAQFPKMVQADFTTPDSCAQNPVHIAGGTQHSSATPIWHPCWGPLKALPTNMSGAPGMSRELGVVRVNWVQWKRE